MSPLTHFSGSGQETQFSAAYLNNVPGVKCKVGHGTGGERSVIAQHSHHNVHDAHAIYINCFMFHVSRNVKYAERCLTDAPADTEIIAGHWPVFRVFRV